MVRIIMAVLALLACTAPLRADELAELRQKGRFVCGVTDILEPFSSRDPASGGMVGYDVDTCGSVARQLGLSVQYKPLPLSARVPELLAGNVDLLAAGLGYFQQRAEQIAFSHRYHVSQHILLARRTPGSPAAPRWRSAGSAS